MLLLTFDIARMLAEELKIDGLENLKFAYIKLHNNTCDLNYNIAPSKNITLAQLDSLQRVLVHPRHTHVFKALDQTPDISSYKGFMIIDQNHDFHQRVQDMTIFFQGIVSTQNPESLNFIFYHLSFLSSDKPYEYFNTNGKQGVMKEIINQKDFSYTGPVVEDKYQYSITTEFVKYSISEYLKFGCTSLDYNKYVNFVKENVIAEIRATLENLSHNKVPSLCKYETDTEQKTLAVYDLANNARESCIALGGTPYSESELAKKFCETEPDLVFHESDLIKITCDNYQELLGFNQTHIVHLQILGANTTSIE